MNKRRLLAKALSGSKNLRYSEVVSPAKAFGFRVSRVKRSHHIFVHSNVRELVNLQEVGGRAKPYQVKQLMELVERYSLDLREDEDR